MSVEKIIEEAITKILLHIRKDNDFFGRVIAVSSNGKAIDFPGCYNNIKNELFG